MASQSLGPTSISRSSYWDASKGSTFCGDNNATTKTYPIRPKHQRSGFRPISCTCSYRSRTSVTDTELSKNEESRRTLRVWPLARESGRQNDGPAPHPAEEHLVVGECTRSNPNSSEHSSWEAGVELKINTSHVHDWGRWDLHLQS